MSSWRPGWFRQFFTEGLETKWDFPLFSLCTVKLSISSSSNHMLDIYQNRRGEEILIPIRNI